MTAITMDAELPDRPRILFLDAYDSFSNNIVSLLATELDADVEILPIDSPHFVNNDGDDEEQQQTRHRLATALRHYDAVVCGPGPGSPASARDVGLMRHVWALPERDLVPALGICLGFQSLALACGADVRRLPTGLHGMVRAIDHVSATEIRGRDDDARESGEEERDISGGGDIFRAIPPFRATLYHSLHADVGQARVDAAAWSAARWKAPPHLPDLVPLAWTYESGVGGASSSSSYSSADVASEQQRILMAIRHRTKPFWGLQYHPESVCTETAGHRVLRNWFAEARRWNRAAGRDARRSRPSPYLSAGITRILPGAHPAGMHRRHAEEEPSFFSAWTEGGSPLANHGLHYEYHSRTLDLPAHIEVPDVVEILQGAPGSGGVDGRREFIVLDSASASAGGTAAASASSRIGPDVRGRYSIVALDVDEALKLEYRAGERHVTVRAKRNTCSEKIDLGPHATVWQFLSDFWARRRLPSPDGEEEGHIGTETPPFVGGFVGYATYELGLEGIGVAPGRASTSASAARPDLCFAWVTRSVVLDHEAGTLRVQMLSPQRERAAAGDPVATAWLDSVVRRLVGSAVWWDDGPQVAEVVAGEPTPPLTPTKTTTMDLGPGLGLGSESTTTTAASIAAPDPAEYEAKVRRCQEYIAAGDSYELCLTERTTITTTTTTTTTTIKTKAPTASPNGDGEDQDVTSSPDSSWGLYRALRTAQPAPFGSYLRLGPATLVSGSPERFLSHSGGPGSVCSMRPMKGTVRKSCPGGGDGGVATLEEARALLRVPKEEAENLMIVDLVRHDLHGVCGGAVAVPRLLAVEEYASVFQMVSVVEGRLPTSPSSSGHHPPASGLDVLAAALPPGSMTGAPKKRSCELLREIEAGEGERGLYSGVVGYMDVRGRGDWSVTIRSLFRWDDEVVVSRCSSYRKDSPEDNEQGEAEEQEQQLVREEKWHIGAGGAVTALSTPQGEREEMFVKLRGPLGVFGAAGRDFGCGGVN